MKCAVGCLPTYLPGKSCVLMIVSASDSCFCTFGGTLHMSPRMTDLMVCLSSGLSGVSFSSASSPGFQRFLTRFYATQDNDTRQTGLRTTAP